MECISRSVGILFLACLIFSLSNGETTFENGKFFIINNVASGKAMTVSGPNYRNGSPVVTSPWIARDTQTWLALFDESSTKKEGRTVGGPQKFVLIPQKQTWDWKDYVQNGEVNITITTLPSNTRVLTLDSTAVNLTQEVYADESSQKWTTEDGGSGEVLIKNWGNQQCIKNFDHRSLNFLETLRKRIDNFFGVFSETKTFSIGNTHLRFGGCE